MAGAAGSGFGIRTPQNGVYEEGGGLVGHDRDGRRAVTLDSFVVIVDPLFNASAGVITHRGGSRLRHTESSTSGASPLVPTLERLVHLPSHPLHSSMAILLLLLLTVVVPPVVGVVATALEAALELLFLCFLCYLLRQHCLPLRVGSRASIALSRAAHCHVLVAELHRRARDVVTVATDVPVARLASPAARPPASPPRTAAWGAAACRSAIVLRHPTCFHIVHSDWVANEGNT